MQTQIFLKLQFPSSCCSNTSGDDVSQDGSTRDRLHGVCWMLACVFAFWCAHGSGGDEALPEAVFVGVHRTWCVFL